MTATTWKCTLNMPYATMWTTAHGFNKLVSIAG